MKYNPLIDYGKKDLSIEENLIFWKFSELIKNLITISSVNKNAKLDKSKKRKTSRNKKA